MEIFLESVFMHFKFNFSSAVSLLQRWNFLDLYWTFGIFCQFFKFLQNRRKIRVINFTLHVFFMRNQANGVALEISLIMNFYCSVFFSSFLFEESFKILKGIIVLKRNIPYMEHIKMVIITRQIFM